MLVADRFVHQKNRFAHRLKHWPMDSHSYTHIGNRDLCTDWFAPRLDSSSVTRAPAKQRMMGRAV